MTWSGQAATKRGAVVRSRSTGVLTLTVLLALGVQVAQAADWYVDPAGNDANTCTAPGPANACLTLQAAINKASATDTIHVAAGTYTVAGLVTVNKTLTLLGAQAGFDARTRAAAESILSNSQGIRIAASNVVIDGFTIQDSTVPAFTGYGVWMDPAASVSGTHVVNDIFKNNIVGVGLANAGPAQVLIQHNLFQSNNQPGGASGTGIYTDEFAGGQVTNVLIDANAFKGNQNAGVGFSSQDVSRPDSNVEISNNSFDQNGRGIYFYNTNSVTIHDNSITNSTVPTDGGTSVAIGAFGDVNGLMIMNNDLNVGALRGIRVGSFLVNPNQNIVIHENNITNFATAGLFVDTGGHVGPVDATCNWWGSATGPTNSGNPGGTGDVVDGDATFNPWLLAPAPEGPCGQALDHFECYEVKPATTVPQSLTVQDQFGSLSETIRFPHRLCAPANKNGEDPSAPTHPQHLTGYVTTRPPFTRRFNQTIVNQFGSITLDVVRPDIFMVPTAKSLTGPPAPLAPPTIDHFQCYKVKRTRGTAKFVKTTATVTDQLENNVTVTLVRPFVLCAPANKNGEDPTAPSHADHLLCYKTKGVAFGTTVASINNQFGPDQVTLIHRRELCVPSLKNPPTTTTTSTTTTSSTTTSSSTSTTLIGSPSGAFTEDLP